MLNVIYAECRKWAHYVERRYAECRYAECRGALPRGERFTGLYWFTKVYGIYGRKFTSVKP